MLCKLKTGWTCVHYVFLAYLLWWVASKFSAAIICATVLSLTDMVWYGLTSNLTHYRPFRRQFYGADDPINSVIALKDEPLTARSHLLYPVSNQCIASHWWPLVAFRTCYTAQSDFSIVCPFYLINSGRLSTGSVPYSVWRYWMLHNGATKHSDTQNFAITISETKEQDCASFRTCE